MNVDTELHKRGFHLEEDYRYDDRHHSLVFVRENCCLIIDLDLCEPEGVRSFEYSKYCEMQNKWMSSYDKLIRVYMEEGRYDYETLDYWLNTRPEAIEATDDGGHFDIAHIDNTPLEKKFEDVFIDAYGTDSLIYLQKEYSLSLADSRSAFIDYVIETKTGSYAIEENGEHYHHPQLIGKKAYLHQLKKQNTLSVFGYKTYRFSIGNLAFTQQAVDTLKAYLGDKKDFKNVQVIEGKRPFALYTHQEDILKQLSEARKQGINTSLIVCPTGTGKSQIAIEDINDLAARGLVRKVLIMAPTVKTVMDWKDRCGQFASGLEVIVETYNRSFIRRKDTSPDYFDYILFDEAHHAQAANCSKTLQYFTPKYLVGMTATAERLDQKKLEDIFGQYKTQMTLKEAIDQDIIADIACYRLLSNIDLSQVRYNGKDYNYADLEKTLVIDSRNRLIVDTIRKYFSPRDGFYKQGLIFCVNTDHTRKLEKMMNEAGIKTRAVYGGNSRNEQYFDEYRERKVQFLTTCQMISEGWDSPQTEVVVMARPTLSKVLYTQQIGRGVRKYEGKDCLYVIDVVDNYEGKLVPMSFNALMKMPLYSAFAGVRNKSHDYLEILGLHESEIAMQEIDIFTFEEKYKDYLSPEQAARELFIGTSSLMNWYRKDPSISSLTLPIGSRMVPYFSATDIETIRESHKLKKHDASTILSDFEDFIDENTLTFSFKLVFMISMLKLADKEGEVDIDQLTEDYRNFYMERIRRGLPVDRANCIFTQEYLEDKTKVKNSILANPFEKFERKRFVYYSRDLKLLSFNPNLWSQMDDHFKEMIINKERQFLADYYEKLGGL